MTSLIGNAPVDGVDVAALLGIPISAEQERAVPVSYTHLTLPTTPSV